MTKIIDIAKTISGATVSAWKDRYYVNLPADRGMRGDQTTKIWIKGSVLTVEEGKGYCSDVFLAAFGDLIDAVTAAGAVRKGYGDSMSATYTLS